MFRGPFRSRRFRNDHRRRFNPTFRIVRQGPLHIPYVRPPLSSFASLREPGLPRRMKQNPGIFKPEGLAQPLPGSVGPGNLYPIWNRKARRADTPISKLELSVR